MNRILFRATVLLAVAFLSHGLTGCSKSPPEIVPVEGLVTLNGKPLPHAEIQFVPLIDGFGGEYIATAVTDEKGRYKLALPAGPIGGCACENIVTVSEGPLPDDARGQSGAAQMKATKFLAGLANRPIPQKYATSAQTPLKLTVTPDRSEYNLELSR